MKTCPKCAYSRKLADKDKPEWQCPACGIAYAKYEDQSHMPIGSGMKPRAPTLQPESVAPMSAKALFWILSGVLAVGYAGYLKLYAPPAANQAPEGVERADMSPRLTPETSAALSQITPSKVVMFATDWCPYCAEARKLFKEQGVRYTEIDIERDPEGAKFQSDQLRVSGVPTIVIGNRLIHGFDEGQILAGLKEL
jgi:glutaredoxin